MSRIGKRPVTVASGIEVSLDGTTLVAKKGKKAILKKDLKLMVELESKLMVQK